MILDHNWMAALMGLTEHSPGILTSIGSIVLYALLRDGLPAFLAYRRRRNGNPGNPGNSGLAARVTACEDFCSRADERWNAQRDFNKRVDKHFERIHDRLDK